MAILTPRPPYRLTMSSRFIILLILLLGSTFPAQDIGFSRTASLSRVGGCARQMTLLNSGNHTLLELTANFANDARERAFWDIPIRMDLSQHSGIRLRLYIQNTPCVKEAQILIKVDGSCYKTQLPLTHNAEWTECFLSKADFAPEESTGSWKQAELLRICLWRKEPGLVSLYLQKFCLEQPNVSLAIIHGNHANEKSRTLSREYARDMAHALALQGIFPAIVEDQDLSQMLLRPYAMALIPSPESLPPSQFGTIISFLRKGGALGLCHSVPPPLAAQMKVPVGNVREIKDIQISGMLPVSQLMPGTHTCLQNAQAIVTMERIPENLRVAAWWMTANGTPTRYPALLFNSNGFWMTHPYQNQAPYEGGALLRDAILPFMPDIRRKAAETSIRHLQEALPFLLINKPSSIQLKANTLLAHSREAFSRKDYPQSIDLVQQTHRLLNPRED